MRSINTWARIGCAEGETVKYRERKGSSYFIIYFFVLGPTILKRENTVLATGVRRGEVKFAFSINGRLKRIFMPMEQNQQRERLKTQKRE